MPKQLEDLTDTWSFNAKLDRIVDGDTQDYVFDLGFHTFKEGRIRLHGVDTAETYGVKHTSDEYTRGKEHEQFTREWLIDDGDMEWPFLVTTLKDTGKYGRFVASVTRKTDGATLNQALRDEFDDV